MRNALCPKIVIDALCLMTTISRRHSRHRRHLQHRRRRSCCRQDHRRLPELIISQTKRTEKIESVTFPCLNQTGEGYAFDFVCAFCLRYDQVWQSTVILAATGSATTMLQMTSMAGMTAVMVVIQQKAPITIF